MQSPIKLLGLAVAGALALCNVAAAASKPVVRTAKYSGVSDTVRNISQRNVPYAGPFYYTRENENPSPWELSLARNKTLRNRIVPDLVRGDGALQSSHPEITAMAPPLSTFEGLNNADSAGANGGAFYVPPDTVGDVGPNDYVQAVNTAVRIYSRDGLPRSAPFLLSDLFAGLGSNSACATMDDGDPIVLYDHLADRWMVSQFAISGTAPFSQCIAISQTGDPTGAWYVYDFVMPNDKLNDYPHFGVWPNAYYMADNQFTASWAGGGVFAFDRAGMLAGNPDASYIYFDLAAVDINIGGMLPADLDGPPPPVGSPGLFSYFVATEFGDASDGLRLFAFAPDFATPANSTFTELAGSPVAVAAFDPVTPNGRGDIPQPAPAAVPTNNLDSIADRLMHRLQYRNFGTHQSLVVTHTVDASGDASAAVFKAGVRYYELRNSGSGWGVNEQATFSPDATHRWMGSAAMDAAGDLAVAYSASSTAVFPSLRYAGRLAGDAANSLAQGEQTLFAGTGVQLTTGTGLRWGDYSALSVDPVDDCRYWYTTEYYANPLPSACTSLGNTAINARCWQTRVGSFAFPGCSAPPKGEIKGKVTLAGVGTPLAGVLVSSANGYVAVTDASGNYRIKAPAGSYNLTASRVDAEAGSASGVPIIGNSATVQDFALTGKPVLSTVGGSVDDSNVPFGNNNGSIDANECLVFIPGIVNSGLVPATGVNALLSTATPNVSITSASVGYGNVPVYGSATSTQTFRFATSPSFLIGTPIEFSLDVSSNETGGTFPFSFPTGTPDATDYLGNGSGPLPIPDNNPTGASLPVTISGVPNAVSKVKVAVYLTHPWMADVTLSLIGPDNTEVVLSSGNGGSGDNMGQNCPTSDGNDTVFDDTAGNSIVGAAAPTLGSFRPQSPLSAFNGKLANGTWKLKAVDVEAPDAGTIQCVTVTVNGTTGTAGVCDDIIFADGFGQ